MQCRVRPFSSLLQGCMPARGAATFIRRANQTATTMQHPHALMQHVWSASRQFASKPPKPTQPAAAKGANTTTAAAPSVASSTQPQQRQRRSDGETAALREQYTQLVDSMNGATSVPETTTATVSSSSAAAAAAATPSSDEAASATNTVAASSSVDAASSKPSTGKAATPPSPPSSTSTTTPPPFPGLRAATLARLAQQQEQQSKNQQNMADQKEKWDEQKERWLGSKVDWSQAGSHRILWHRSLTKHEIAALLGLLVANLWMLFLQMQAEDETKALTKKDRVKDPSAPPHLSELELFLDRHFEVSLDNITEGRLYTLMTSSLRHYSMTHCIGNCALLMMCGPGLIAAGGLRMFVGVFAASSVVGWGAELAVRDIITPQIQGRASYPFKKKFTESFWSSSTTTNAQKETATAAVATTTAAPMAPAATATTAVTAAPPAAVPRSKLLEAAKPQHWMHGAGSSPVTVSLGALWLLAYRQMPLGRSPLAKVIGVIIGFTAAKDLYNLTGIWGADPADTRIVVHGMGAAVGTAFFFAALRKPAARAAALKNAQAAASMRFQAKGAPVGAAAGKHHTNTAAAAASNSSSIVPVADDASAPSLLSNTPPARPVLPKITDTPSPANADMRASPPTIQPRRRHFSTIAKRWSTVRPIGRQPKL